ncbi:hypothetical protein NMG60_11014061 [Bertholletia excelsa]
MLGISYGELFLLIGATAALDLPIIARTAGRLAGRAIGYVQLARGQFDNIMQQTQARQVHKELQDTIAQLEAIRHEIVKLQNLISDVHAQVTAYAKLAESTAVNLGSAKSKDFIDDLTDESGLLVLSVSAESIGLLPNHIDDVQGSDIVLEAIFAAEVAWNAKEFFAQDLDKIKTE